MSNMTPRIPSRIAATFMLLVAVSVHGQTMRGKYCTEHPDDHSKCKAITFIGKDGNKAVIGIPVVCAGDTRHSDILEWLQYDGMDEDLYEKSGLCKLTADEYSTLFAWHLSREASRIYFRTDEGRPQKRIYVSLDFEQDTPDILKSAFRSSLRQVPDVELVDGPTGDVVVRVIAIPTAHDPAGEKTAYSVFVASIVMWKVPDFPSDKMLQEARSGLLLVFPTDKYESSIRDAVASVDNSVFEDFRKTWPYRNARDK